MSMTTSFVKLNLRTKLIIGFSIVITFVIVISGASFYAKRFLNNNAKIMYEKDLIGVSLLKHLNRDLI
jgi:CHASE3 domain sensor protein